MLDYTAQPPNIIERLKDHFGTYSEAAYALGVADNYPTRWKAQGFIPEAYALEIEELRITDSWGEIDAYTVLREARRARNERNAA